VAPLGIAEAGLTGPIWRWDQRCTALIRGGCLGPHPLARCEALLMQLAMAHVPSFPLFTHQRTQFAGMSGTSVGEELARRCHAGLADIPRHDQGLCRDPEEHDGAEQVKLSDNLESWPAHASPGHLKCPLARCQKMHQPHCRVLLCADRLPLCQNTEHT
jgi:hypothetical protein